MTKKSEKRIAIIGGGFCGTMTAVHLLLGVKKPLEISLYNSGYPISRGVAYQTYSEQHLLNVPCGKMSAFSSNPDHFFEWYCSKNKIQRPESYLKDAFLPRNVYGSYLEEIFENAIRNKPDEIHFNSVSEEVVDIIKGEDDYIIKLLSGKSFRADKIVLATGNHSPSNPLLKDKNYLESPMYFGNPWQENSVIDCKQNEPVLVIGTGLTMVDVVLGLNEKGFNGKVIAVSPHGFKILSHKKNEPNKNIFDDLQAPFELTDLFQLFYKHIREAKAKGESSEIVVDAIRSKTQLIWQQLTLADKKKFITHIRHLWGVARHRIPGEIYSKIHDLIKDDRLEIIAGRINSITASEDNLVTEIILRGTNQSRSVKSQRIINCTGPLTDITKYESPLYSNLLKRQIVRADEMKLGLEASANGNIIDESGHASTTFYTIGSLLKGKLWESTAIPELRIQAENLAKLLVADE